MYQARALSSAETALARRDVNTVECAGMSVRITRSSNDVDRCSSAEDFTQSMIEDPGIYPDLPVPLGFSLTNEQRDRIALAGLRARFGELRKKISVLDRMAASQGVDEIRTIEDGVFLLFPHTVYKSYSLSVLESGRFDRLTKWMQGLTAVDLSGVTGKPFESIDDWIIGLNDQLGVQIVHTSGTTGKLSFLPRLKLDQTRRFQMMAHSVRDWNGLGAGPDILATPCPVICPSYRFGAGSSHRTFEAMADLVARDESNVLALYSDRFSADVASLAGRLRTAQERGEQGKVQLSPSLLARRDEFLRRNSERAMRLEEFFAEAQRRFAGRNVVLSNVLTVVFEWAEAGLSRGIHSVFGPQSVLFTGGGAKGRELPPNTLQMIFDFLGVNDAVLIYSMSEISGICRLCDHDHYHIPPFLVPYVLDPDTGQPAPRHGRQTGRFGVMDLFPSDHWGGFLSGDKVTIAGWDEPCACGRTGPYIENSVQRYSELEGGDDKITCAGAPAAHDQAIEYLASLAD